MSFRSKTRKIDPECQVELITKTLEEFNLMGNQNVVEASISSVSDWVANKSCRLRKHFLELGSTC